VPYSSIGIFITKLRENCKAQPGKLARLEICLDKERNSQVNYLLLCEAVRRFPGKLTIEEVQSMIWRVWGYSLLVSVWSSGTSAGLWEMIGNWLSQRQ